MSDVDSRIHELVRRVRGIADAGVPEPIAARVTTLSASSSARSTG
ncbi:hypothetical protein OV079_31410 [Nannocystis pusilla]|uniref:Uncharacterized protein n=1 Tax=Nannocystis pusilla TaxID=889268 RepID=A0A9X3F210_9BACT|nr:hypothetical protein [Nannocystis pusilla]MCY1009993.1 hypothetical protein [Nannocystis pusilla]